MAMPSTRVRVVCTLGVTIETLAADQPVDQRRLAGIGRADERDDSRSAVVVPSRHAAGVERRRAPTAAAARLGRALRGARSRSRGGRPSTLHRRR